MRRRNLQRKRRVDKRRHQRTMRRVREFCVQHGLVFSFNSLMKFFYRDDGISYDSRTDTFKKAFLRPYEGSDLIKRLSRDYSA